MLTNSESPYVPKFHVSAENVKSELNKHILADGFDIIIDLEKSSGAYITNAKTGKKYLDFFTCVASMPVGMNHPKMLEHNFIQYIGQSAINKPSNSDIYSEQMATFVKTFFEIAVPKDFHYAFFVEGGSVAVENAVKTAFDWKVRKNQAKGYTHERGHQIMHFRQSFHGRTGYALSLTNTDPTKTLHYPKFDWPRIHNPTVKFPLNEENLAHTIEQENRSIEEMKQAFHDRKDDIAAIIIETIQGEGGDNHFRPEFFAAMRELADANEALLIFDEVQTGVGITGTMWAYEQTGVVPDIMSFGKKMQVCGIVAGKRLDEVAENVFRVSSRINSTWGGNLVDMVRSTKYLEIISEENLVENAKTTGAYLLSQLNQLCQNYPNLVSNVRGQGLFCAFDVPNPDIRKKFLAHCYEGGLMILPSGNVSIRFRPPLILSESQVDDGILIIENALKQS